MKRRLTRNQYCALLSICDVERYHVPPVYQGQTVVTSYGCNADYIYERSHDRGDNIVWITAYSHPRGDAEFDPWNVVPTTGRRVGLIYNGPLSCDPSRPATRG